MSVVKKIELSGLILFLLINAGCQKNKSTSPEAEAIQQGIPDPATEDLTLKQGDKDQVRCFVDIDRTCSSKQSPWPALDTPKREYLYWSDDVQKSALGCRQFTTLLMTECQVSIPVTVMFYDERGGLEETFVASGGDPDMKKDMAELPVAFRNYFLNCDDYRKKAEYAKDGKCRSCEAPTVPVVDFYQNITCKVPYDIVGYSSARTDHPIVPYPFRDQVGKNNKIDLKTRSDVGAFSHIYLPLDKTKNRTLDLSNYKKADFRARFIDFMQLVDPPQLVGLHSGLGAKAQSTCQPPYKLVKHLATGEKSCKIHAKKSPDSVYSSSRYPTPGSLICFYEFREAGKVHGLATKVSSPTALAGTIDAPTCYPDFYIASKPAPERSCDSDWKSCNGSIYRFRLTDDSEKPLLKREIEDQYVFFEEADSDVSDSPVDTIYIVWNSLGGNFKYSLDLKDSSGKIYPHCIGSELLRSNTVAPYSGFCPDQGKSRPDDIVGAKICASDDGWKTSACSSEWADPNTPLIARKP